MSDFSEPPAKRNPKIAEPVPYDRLPDDKKKEYGDFSETSATESVEPVTESKSVRMPEVLVFEFGDKELTFTDGLLTAVGETVNKPPELVLPTEEERQQFIRSILGNKPYEREYTIFGDIKVGFKDRSVAETEQMFKRVMTRVETERTEGTEPTDSMVQFLVDLERLASTFYRYNGDPAQDVSSYARPVYQALMACSRDFEEHVTTLTEKAQEKSFWKAGGAV